MSNSLEREIDYLEQELERADRDSRLTVSELNRTKELLHMVLWCLEPEVAIKVLQTSKSVINGGGILLPYYCRYELPEEVQKELNAIH